MRDFLIHLFGFPCLNDFLNSLYTQISPDEFSVTLRSTYPKNLNSRRDNGVNSDRILMRYNEAFRLNKKR